MSDDVRTIDVAGRVTKRRSGPRTGGLQVADSRPPVIDGLVVGVRCTVCRHPSPQPVLRCPVCFGEVAPERFGPGGIVWSSTVVHLRVSGREPPFALAYVDLDDGPRILAHLEGAARVMPGTRVSVVGAADGDIQVSA
ncbi:MAG TPA: OB-fold domain-containing protein [Solirubrobacteraceae bacterium]|jgi:hypothetical protein|nr:OB-fold domain-containing protein [Solirubrobacteraceae bacterium]